MQAPGLSKIDEIWEVIRHHGRDFSADELCNFFFPDKVGDGSDRYIRRLLSDDIRFIESRPGHWFITSQDSENTPLSQLRYCVFDFETTGGTPPVHRAIELGAVLVENGVITESFKTLIQPNRQIPEFVVRLTGIRDSDLRHAPSIETVLNDFMQFCEGTVLVAHNALFDINFLAYEVNRVLGKPLPNPGICTLKLSRDLVPEAKAHKLDVLAEHFGYEIADRHRAWDDALATAKLLIQFIALLSDAGLHNLGDIRKFMIKPRADYFPKVLMSPDEIENLPEGPGYIAFQDRHKRTFHCQAFKHLNQEISGLVYSDMRGSRLKLVWRKAESFTVHEVRTYFDAVLAAASHKGVKSSSGIHQYFVRVIDDKGLVAVVNRQPKAPALYYGPFFHELDLKQKLGSMGEEIPVTREEFSPRLNYRSVFMIANAQESLKQLGPSSHETDLLVVVPSMGTSPGIEFYFIRSGQIQGKHSAQAIFDEDLTQTLEALYDKVFLGPPIDKKSADEQQSAAFMEWLQHDARREEQCRLFPVEIGKLKPAAHFVADLMLRLMDLM